MSTPALRVPEAHFPDSCKQLPEFTLKMQAVNPMLSSLGNINSLKNRRDLQSSFRLSPENDRPLFAISKNNALSRLLSLPEPAIGLCEQLGVPISLSPRDENQNTKTLTFDFKKIKKSADVRPELPTSNVNSLLGSKVVSMGKSIDPIPLCQPNFPNDHFSNPFMRPEKATVPQDIRFSKTEIVKTEKHALLVSTVAPNPSIRFSTPEKSNRKHNSIGDLSVHQIVNEKFNADHCLESPKRNMRRELDYYGDQQSSLSEVLQQSKANRLPSNTPSRMKVIVSQIEEDTFLKMTDARQSPSLFASHCSPDFRKKFHHFFSSGNDKDEVVESPDVFNFSRLRSKSCDLLTEKEIELIYGRNRTQPPQPQCTTPLVAPLPKYTMESFMSLYLITLSMM